MKAAGLTRDLPPLSLRAAFQPGTVNDESRTVDLVWTTGARVLRGFFERFWEELSLDPNHVRMDRLNNGAPFLDNHDSFGSASSVAGVVESARIVDGKGIATVRFARAADDPAADAIFRKVKDGILQNVSVGYRVHKMEKVSSGDEEIPVYRAVDWEPYELSVVPMGADDGAGFRSGSRGELNPCTFAGQEKEHTMADKTPPVAEPTPPAKPTANAVDESIRAAAALRQAEAEQRAAAAARDAERTLKAEREREVEIRALIRRGGLGDEEADKLIREGVPVEDVRKAVLEHLTAKTDADPLSRRTTFTMGEDRREKFIRGAAASMYERAGHRQMLEAAKKNDRVGHLLQDVATDPGEFRGMKLIDLARQALEIRGASTRGLFGERLVKAALDYRGDSGFQATGDFTVLLETAVNKVFLGRYATIPVTWPGWCARKSVQDFRTSTFYRPGAFSVLDAVTEQGEVKHKNIPDGAKATLTPATKGNIIGISRKAIVNDDLGFLRDNASELGAAAARTIETDAWALITVNSGLGVTQSDSQPLFHTNRANIGTTGAMSVATLDSIRVKMGLQKDPAANAYLALSPAILLVPLELTGTAKTFNASAADPTDYKNALVFNKVNGLFETIIGSPFLSASSATRVYGLADPNVGPVFAVGFIDGQEAPTLTSEQSFTYDGLQMKVIMDYGTAVIDYRGGVTCAGA